uniref:hypothetical protein n=1 Tax=Pseudomonas sp. EA_65y_Pfl1_P113 TaxID=3088692 RepID=UPI0030D80AC0
MSIMRRERSIRDLEAEIAELREAATALAERTIRYVGHKVDPNLECDNEIRDLANATLALSRPQSPTPTPGGAHE